MARRPWLEVEDERLPMRWLGRCPPVPQWSPGSATISLQSTGPHKELEQVPLSIAETTRAAGPVVRNAVRQSAPVLPLVVGRVGEGAPGLVEAIETTLAALMDELADERGEEWRLVPLGGVRCRLDWHTTVETRRPPLELVEGLNVEPDLAGTTDKAEAYATCQITDTELWTLRRGDVVGVRWPGEPTGWFTRAEALVLGTTYSVLDPIGMTLSLKLRSRS